MGTLIPIFFSQLSYSKSTEVRQQNLDWKKIQLIKKYHLEGLNPGEIELFLHWKATDPEFAQAAEAMASKQSFKQDLEQLQSIDEDAAWSRFSQKHLPKGPKLRSISSSWYRAAAVFVGVFAFTAIWWMEFSKRNAEVRQHIPAGSFSNKLGRVSAFLLPDSTQIWLSTGSELRYGENFTTNRKVWLQGEAFFEVKRNLDFPFEISTDAVTTKVLGTSFNLKAYPGEGVDLSVYSGKVQFGKPGADASAFFLTKDQSISWSSSAGFSEIGKFDSAVDPDWKSGVFRFENASVDEIVTALGRWYPVEFEVGGDTGRCRFSGEFHRSSLEQVLEVLSYTLNLNYQINEKTIEITSKPC